MAAESKQVMEIVNRFNRAKSERDGAWNAVYQDCADYVMPRKNNITSVTKGERKDLKIYNSTAVRSNEKHAAGIFSYSCPPDKRWFGMRAKNNELQKIDEVKRWFGEVTQIIFEDLANSNFNSALHEALLDLGVFGTCCIYQEEGRKKALNFTALHIMEFYFLEDSEGTVDTVFRSFKLTARQAVQKFGEENLSEEIMKAANDERQQDTEFDFLHAVSPRTERDEDKIDALNMPYASYYIDLKAKKLIKESGYQELPYHVARYSKASGEIAGRGPAMSCLGEIKLSNKMDEDIMLAAEMRVKPPWTAPSDDLDLNINASPGGITYYKPNAYGSIPQPINTMADIQIGREEVERKEQFIYRAFYNDLFEVLADRKNMTATEVIERVEERLIAFAPALGRMQSELFSPLLNRSFGICLRTGQLPPPPPELLDDPYYEIEYVSKLALAIKMLENRSFAQTMEMLMGLVEVDPGIMDNLNLDKVVQGVAHNNGMPLEWLRSEKEVEQIRALKAKAQEQMQQMAMMQQAADAVPKLQQPTQPGSPLAAMMGR